MQGFAITITPREELPDGIRFRLYDNNELVVDNIGTLDFQYLIPDPYVGEHDLAVTYFRETIPSIESEKRVAYSENFTLPILEYEVLVETF